ncbi:hypothetical protein Agub_g12137 [Astrephomene gubernaculifera]|uniref:EGF-like domain-containing protein n=1 Tax=Astrephomene gubernaculifera TaxID=47775 RepID=A0AAD3DXQ5_9CHLO|nr:hypothetical protein Agub_g12137 [Astrephomene gubernaculifera]
MRATEKELLCIMNSRATMGRHKAALLLPVLLAVAMLPLGSAVFTEEEILSFTMTDASLEGHSRSLLQATTTATTGSSSTSAASALPQLPSTPEEHCPLARGTWCGPYYQQTPTPRPPPKRGNKSCPNNCSGVGQCHYDHGICYCPIGFGGPDCSTPRKRPCWRMGPDKRDEGWHNHTDWSHSRCAGICDDSNSMCYCPPETKYGRKEAPPGSPPGTPPVQVGRPMYWCQPSTDKDGTPVKWGAVKYEDLFGPGGWCNADVPKFLCPCRIDGRIGALCNIPVEQFCPNQCSGRGECDQGFCRCHAGWYGSDCSRRRAGASMEETLPDYLGPKPWLAAAVTPPVAAEDPPRTAPQRKRPYVYVYDVKPEYSSDILQYRIERVNCKYRQWELGNNSVWITYNAYAVEPLLQELFLTSEHRTFDPEEADYFFVPIMWACLFDVYGWNPIPRWPADVHGPRPYGASVMQLRTAQWLNATFPWFSRRGGRDHIWLTATDEGACSVFKDVWPGIFLTHWGRTDFPHLPNSQYHADYYAAPIKHVEHDGEWLDQTSRAHPCFDPKKDLVIPAFKRPEHYKRSPYMGAPQYERSIFLFFRGDLRIAPGQDPECKYSRCIRQTLYNMSREGNWREKYNVWFGDTRNVPGDYSELLAKSVFCLVLPGDGWSPRLEDAVLHGCIPVIIMDDVQVVFESILDVTAFSIRIAQKDLAKVVDIVQAVPEGQIRIMQNNLAKVWYRFRYLGLKMADADAAAVVSEHRATNGGLLRPNPGAQYAASRVDDAFSTLMQWLYARIPDIQGKL